MIRHALRHFRPLILIIFIDVIAAISFFRRHFQADFR